MMRGWRIVVLLALLILSVFSAVLANRQLARSRDNALEKQVSDLKDELHDMSQGLGMEIEVVNEENAAMQASLGTAIAALGKLAALPGGTAPRTFHLSGPGPSAAKATLIVLPGAAYLAAEDVPQPAPGDELVITTVPDGKEVGRFKVGRDGRGVAEIAFPAGDPALAVHVAPPDGPPRSAVVLASSDPRASEPAR